jgi:hypothetical protein
VTGSRELIHSLCEPDTPRRPRHDLKGANGKQKVKERSAVDTEIKPEAEPVESR